MSFRPRVIIPWFPGTNCHQEMAYAFQLAGANPKIVTINDLAAKRTKLSDTDLIGFAGGFSYGDHFRSGAFAASDLLHLLGDQLAVVREKDIPILGVCNGFQILVETGLLPGNQKIGQTTAVLDRNRSTKFEHWCDIPVYFPVALSTSCVWTSEVEGNQFSLPVGHGEGRLIPETSDSYIVIAAYAASSPNGSPIAGICSPDGLVMGLMPHPERRVNKIYGGDQGLAIFRSGVAAVS